MGMVRGMINRAGRKAFWAIVPNLRSGGQSSRTITSLSLLTLLYHVLIIFALSKPIDLTDK